MGGAVLALIQKTAESRWRRFNPCSDFCRGFSFIAPNTYKYYTQYSMAESKVTPKEIKHIAELSQITLTGEEEKKFAEIFTDIVGYIDVLGELDTSKTEETHQVTGLVNVYQKDGENEVTLSQDAALKNAKNVEKGLFVTEAVFNR